MFSMLEELGKLINDNLAVCAIAFILMAGVTVGTIVLILCLERRIYKNHKIQRQIRMNHVEDHNRYLMSIECSKVLLRILYDMICTTNDAELITKAAFMRTDIELALLSMDDKKVAETVTRLSNLKDPGIDQVVDLVSMVVNDRNVVDPDEVTDAVKDFHDMIDIISGKLDAASLASYKKGKRLEKDRFISKVQRDLNIGDNVHIKSLSAAQMLSGTKANA